MLTGAEGGAMAIFVIAALAGRIVALKCVPLTLKPDDREEVVVKLRFDQLDLLPAKNPFPSTANVAAGAVVARASASPPSPFPPAGCCLCLLLTPTSSSPSSLLLYLLPFSFCLPDSELYRSDHPNVCQFHGAEYDADHATILIAMEFMDLRSLK
eukprot:660441-Hanusia_phi.AAC.4